ncbi:MAG: sodium:solute symporter family protein, partial [Deltaproteobacteria bacterium]|nr:sodium:solute symporter family protein [Deltaproteobacteria bacterium]
SGLAIPIVAGFYQEKLRLNSTGALAAIIGGGGVSLIGKLMGIDHIGLFGFAISGMLLFGISRLRKN